MKIMKTISLSFAVTLLFLSSASAGGCPLPGTIVAKIQQLIGNNRQKAMGIAQQFPVLRGLKLSGAIFSINKLTLEEISSTQSPLLCNYKFGNEVLFTIDYSTD